MRAFLALIIFVIAAPLIETILFQYLPITLIMYLLKNYKRRQTFSILISATLFGLSHPYNLTYIFLAFLVGVVFAYFFLLSIKRKEIPFLNVFLIHLLLNFIPYSRDFILIHL